MTTYQFRLRMEIILRWLMNLRRRSSKWRRLALITVMIMSITMERRRDEWLWCFNFIIQTFLLSLSLQHCKFLDISFFSSAQQLICTYINSMTRIQTYEFTLVRRMMKMMKSWREGENWLRRTWRPCLMGPRTGTSLWITRMMTRRGPGWSMRKSSSERSPSQK